MGEYANMTSRRLRRFLAWLGNNKGVDVVTGGTHPIKVVCQRNKESYPLPMSHRIVNKHIVKDFMEWLARNGICTKEEFDERI